VSSAILEDLDRGSFDFVDYGCSNGSSMQLAQSLFGAGSGLGVDIDPVKVATVRDQGLPCLEADAIELDLGENRVRYAILSHFLEHLPDLDAVGRAVENGARLARDFLFIQGPFFEADDYLEELGLKFYWSDWSGHPTHLRLSDLERIISDLTLPDPVFMFAREIRDSLDPTIHPMSSPRNQHDYSAADHDPKPQIEFEHTLYRELICVCPLRPGAVGRHLLARIAAKRRAVRTSGWPVEPARSGWRSLFFRPSRRR
jgi:hypothetical protein